MLTVLMATHNGAATLPRVLAAYRQLHSPADGWELVIVNNASTDNTAQILGENIEGLPARIVCTDKQGKNHALNLGIPAALQSELVIFTDDDILPHPDWLVIYQTAAQSMPQFDLFGGAIEAIWPKPCPAWVPRLVNLGAAFGITPNNAIAGPISATRVWGGNMAVRGSVFAAGHRFNEVIGPAAGQYIMGSELEFTCRVEAAGHRAWFLTDSRVGHIIRDRQLTTEWIMGRGFRLGRHMYYQERDKHLPGTSMWRGAPRWMYRKLMGHQIESLLGRARGDFDQRFQADWELSILRGYLKEARAQSLKKP